MSIFRNRVYQDASPIERQGVPVPYANQDPETVALDVVPMNLHAEFADPDFHNLPMIANTLPAIIPWNAPVVVVPREYHGTKPGATMFDLDGLLPAGEIGD